MSLLLISQAYSFSNDEDENAVASTAKEKISERLKDSRGDVESTVNLKRRTPLRLAKQFKTENQSDLKKRRKKLAECSRSLNKLSRKSHETGETKLEDEDDVNTSFLDLLDQMKTKNSKTKQGDQTNEVPGKITSTGKKNESDRNRQITGRQKFPLKTQQTKSLAKNQCIMCFKQFDRIENLRRHILSHIGEKPFSCNVCNESFARMSTLKYHKLTHKGEKPYNCTSCYKSFVRLSHLTAHQVIHTGEKPFHCSVCSARFNHSNNLRIHERIHTGEKPYQCKICSKRFAALNNFKRHERIHTNEKRFKCLSCDKTYSRSDALKHHTQQHTKI